jgi:hypothetical protein
VRIDSIAASASIDDVLLLRGNACALTATSLFVRVDSRSTVCAVDKNSCVKAALLTAAIASVVLVSLSPQSDCESDGGPSAVSATGGCSVGFFLENAASLCVGSVVRSFTVDAPSMKVVDDGQAVRLGWLFCPVVKDSLMLMLVVDGLLITSADAPEAVREEHLV